MVDVLSQRYYKMLEQPEHKQKVIMITTVVRASTYLILSVF